MAYGNLCVRCGQEEDAHIENIVNEAITEHNSWFFNTENGFPLSCAACLETSWPDEYVEAIKGTHYEFAWWEGGYMSPDPEEESRQFDIESKINLYGSYFAIIVFNDGDSVVIDYGT